MARPRLGEEERRTRTVGVRVPVTEAEAEAEELQERAQAAPELKRLAGAAATGRKLEKPVCHYSLNWAKEEKPDRQEMSRAAEESLKALGLERHQALIVSHRDGQPHVHVIANRVDPESGKAAGLSRSKLKLSKWAERYERRQGEDPVPGAGEEQQAAGGGGAGCGWARAFGRALQAGADESAAGAAGSDPGGAGRAGAGASGLAAGRGAHAMGAASAVAGGRISVNWRGGVSGSGRRFTGVKSGSGSSWQKTAVGC